MLGFRNNQKVLHEDVRPLERTAIVVRHEDSCVSHACKLYRMLLDFDCDNKKPDFGGNLVTERNKV